MKKNRWPLVLGTLAALAAGPALAQERGFYFGGSVGQAEYNDTCEGFAPVTACDDSDTAFRVFGGFQFNKNLGIEVGWANLGEIGAQGLFSGVPTSFRAEATGFDFSGVLSFSIIDRLYFFGKLGAYYVKSDVDLNVGGVVSQTNHDNSGFVYGLGLGYDLWKLGLRAEWSRYDSGVRSAFAEDDVNVFSVGVMLRF